MRDLKIKSVIFLTALMMALSAAPTSAGVVSVMNTNEYNAYAIRYKYYNFGIEKNVWFCIGHGQSETKDHFTNAIFYISVNHMVDNSCNSGKYLEEIIKDYNVDGTPTAFRKFVVTIADGHKVVIAEQK